MADNMFAEPVVNVGGKRRYTVLMSIVVHALVMAAIAIVPLVATDSVVLPSRSAMRAFFVPPPLPPPLPPPRGVVTQRPPVDTPAFPIEAPRAIIPESPLPSVGQPASEYVPGIVSGGDYFALLPSPSTPPATIPPRVPLPVGGDIKRPVKVRDVAPGYPAIARAARVEGIVIVEATIGPNGKVQDARVLRSIPLLDAAALDAVRQWEYTPTLLNDTPIAIVMTVTVDFRLR